ncbi:MAG: SHOCT domain-containing protein [Lachnospiraceae bacterium]|nr:SHOCT domain-containing protein [Lachnospiraceae bacterium]
MGFFFSKESREQRVREKELERQREYERKEQLRREEEERKERIEQQKKAFCIWYSGETQRFINELQEKNFNPTWGFEVEPDNNTQQGIGGKQYGDVYIFDIPEIEGLAFDTNTKQMLYYTCPTGYYDTYNKPGTHLEYKYVLIPFDNIFKATVEVNSQTTVSTVTSKQNVIGRSIVGGILAGDAGAIIGGTTGKENSVSKSEVLPKKIVFNIQTTNLEYPIIAFEFNKPYWGTGAVSGDKDIADTMWGIFSGQKELAYIFEWERRRKCNTYIDRYYHRVHGAPEHDGNNEKEYQPILDYIMPFSNLEIVLKRVNRYAMQIESIIQQCNAEKQSNNDTGIDIIAELTKLADMKEKGIITEEEFAKLKAKLI